MSGITNPAEPYFKDGVWGWDGSVWRKLPLLFGYSNRWAEAIEVAAVGAGDGVASTVAVPPGYVYVLQAVSVWHNAGAAKSAVIFLYSGTVGVYLAADATLASDTWLPGQAQAALMAGDIVRGIVYAPGDGKLIRLRVWGYKMKVTE